MNSPDLLARQEYIAYSVETTRDLIMSGRISFPDIAVISEIDAINYLDRLFVPEVDVDSSGDLHLTSPDAIKGQDALGIIALRPGERVFLDKELVTPSTSQRDSVIRYLESLADQFPGDPTSAVNGGIGFLQEYMTHSPLVHDPRTTAQSLCQGITTEVLPRTFPGLQGTRVHQLRSRPLLVLSYRQTDSRTNPSVLLHETDHSIEALGQGIRAVFGEKRTKHRLRSELRGYNMGAWILDQLKLIDYDDSNDSPPLERVTRAIEEIRRSLQSSADPFEPNDNILAKIHETGYGGILGTDNI